jgi:hypothetical protein
MFCCTCILSSAVAPRSTSVKSWRHVVGHAGLSSTAQSSKRSQEQLEKWHRCAVKAGGKGGSQPGYTVHVSSGRATDSAQHALPSMSIVLRLVHWRPIMSLACHQHQVAAANYVESGAAPRSKGSKGCWSLSVHQPRPALHLATTKAFASCLFVCPWYALCAACSDCSCLPP